MKDINATVIVDLTPNEDEIMAGLQKDARWGVHRAIREGLNVEESNNDSDWREFYNIYSEELGEKGVRLESFEHVREHGNVFFICKYQGKIIAGATLELMENGVPKLSRHSSLKEFRKMQPNNLIYWNAILWGKKNGYKQLDLGGWQINADEKISGVNEFKEKWGKVVYFYKDYPFFEAIKRKLYRNFKLLRKLK